MKKTIIALFAITLMACENKSSISHEMKGEFKLELLFEKDGCKVYRFYDTHWVYWSTCEGRFNSDFTERTGKNSHEVKVESITVNK